VAKDKKKKKQDKIDDEPQVQAAEKTVRSAREELRKAEQYYHEVRDKAAQRMDQLRKTTFGDVIDGTIELAKKHPAASLAVATAAGFFLGRLFRR